MPYGNWINDTYHYVCTLHSKDMDGEVVVK